MASFVEEATLTINDRQAKASIKSLESAIKSLNRTAKGLNRVKLFDTSTKQAQRNIQSLARSINKLPKSKTITVTTNNVTRNTVRGAASSARQASGGSRFGAARFSAGFWAVNTAANTAAGALRSLAGAAGEAVTAAQGVDTRQVAIFGKDSIISKTINQSAEDAVRQIDRISLTRARQIGNDLALGGVTAQNLPALTNLQARTESSVGALFPGLEKSVTLFNNKMFNLANSTDDLARSQKLAQGAAQGIAAAGESFSAPTTIASLRNSGLAPTINDKGLFNLIQLTDALGQNAGTQINRLSKELFLPTNQAGAGGGVSKGAIANLNARGLRGFTSAEQALFTADPTSFVEQVLSRRLQAQGVDTNNRTQLAEYLKTSGFGPLAQKLLTQIFTSIDERAQQFKATSGIDINNPNNGTETNLALATKNLSDSFNTLSATVLTPLAEKVAPYVNELAQGIEKIALSKTNLDDLALGVTSAATAFGIFKGGQSMITSLFNPLNASAVALDGSAGALTRAAIALGGSGVAGGGLPGGAPGSKVNGLSTTQLGTSLLVGVVAAVNAAGKLKEVADSPDRGKAYFAELAKQDEANSAYIKGLMNQYLGQTLSDLIVAPKEKFGPFLPSGMGGADREAALGFSMDFAPKIDQWNNSVLTQTDAVNRSANSTDAVAAAIERSNALLAQIASKNTVVNVNVPKFGQVPANVGTVQPTE